MKIRITNISGNTILVQLEPLGDFLHLSEKEKLLFNVTKNNEEGIINLIIDQNAIILEENNDVYIDLLGKE